MITMGRADRANQAILDNLALLHDRQTEMREQIEQMDRVDRLILSHISEIASRILALAPAAGAGPRPESPPRRRPSEREGADFPLAAPSSGHDPAVGESPNGSVGLNGTDAGDVDKRVGPEPAPVAGQDEPVEHTTAAHRLLRWPSIRAAFAKSSTRGLSDDYVMKLEEGKGVLRVYGRGEGRDAGDGGHPSPTGSIASPHSDEGSEVRSPLPSDKLWGSGFADAPAVRDVGGLGRDGKLEVDGHTLEKLLKLYLENIHILHPFLDKNTLTKMVKKFAADYNPGTHPAWPRLEGAKPSASTAFEGRREPAIHPPKSAKRKHSDTQYQGVGLEPVSPPAPSAAPPPFQRAVSNAIVLFVMALGKICEWRAPLPGPVSDDGKENSTARPPAFWPFVSCSDSASPLSVRQSPASSTHTTSNTSTMSTPSAIPLRDPTARHSAEDPSAGLRNVDVIPGLAYYAAATDIMGNCHGGNDLSHVQANLLAALYAGQLARAFESWTWIHSASRACRYLLRE